MSRAGIIVLVPLPVITNCFRVVLNWVCAAGPGQRAVNVMHVVAPGKTQDQIYAAFDTNMHSSLWENVSSDSGVETVDITPLDGSTATLEYVTGLTSKWMGNASVGAMIAVAQVVKFRTGIRGRSYRGHIYLPFTSEAQYAVGEFNNTDTNSCQAAWRTFASNIEAAGVTPVVASYKLSTAAIITAIDVETPAATQRRRQSRLRVA